MTRTGRFTGTAMMFCVVMSSLPAGSLRVESQIVASGVVDPRGIGAAELPVRPGIPYVPRELLGGDFDCHRVGRRVRQEVAGPDAVAAEWPDQGRAIAVAMVQVTSSFGVLVPVTGPPGAPRAIAPDEVTRDPSARGRRRFRRRSASGSIARRSAAPCSEISSGQPPDTAEEDSHRDGGHHPEEQRQRHRHNSPLIQHHQHQQHGQIQDGCQKQSLRLPGRANKRHANGAIEEQQAENARGAQVSLPRRTPPPSRQHQSGHRHQTAGLVRLLGLIGELHGRRSFRRYRDLLGRRAILFVHGFDVILPRRQSFDLEASRPRRRRRKTDGAPHGCKPRIHGCWLHLTGMLDFRPAEGLDDGVGPRRLRHIPLADSPWAAGGCCAWYCRWSRPSGSGRACIPSTCGMYMQPFWSRTTGLSGTAKVLPSRPRLDVHEHVAQRAVVVERRPLRETPCPCACEAHDGVGIHLNGRELRRCALKRDLARDAAFISGRPPDGLAGGGLLFRRT